ncbi:MAG: C13 family peptidase [Sphingomonadaceae bacterium]
MQRTVKQLVVSSALVAASLLLGSATCQSNKSPEEGAGQGASWEQGRSATWELSQQKRLASALLSLKPQRPGVIDAYLVVVGLDADPVFGREAAEAAKVLARRYDAVGRTILLSAGSPTAPNGSPAFLAASLAAVAAKMNLKEDALVLYTTSHGGHDVGLAYRDGENGYGLIAPQRMAALLAELKIERRLVMISACYSGQFVGALAHPDTAIVTAADDDRTSFGCAPGNDWTYFGDALINNELRKRQPFEKAAAAATALISSWEFAEGLTPSKPRLFIGESARLWLAKLEARIPPGTTPKVGRPALESSKVP